MKKMHVTRATKKKQLEQEKDDKSPAYAEAVKEEQECLEIFSKVNVEFSRYRALNHVCMGTYVSYSFVPIFHLEFTCMA